MDDNLRELIEHYRPQAASLVPHELYRLARSGGLSIAHAAVILRNLYGFGFSECIQILRDCGDDPLEGS